jgi:hypothetical protein
MLCKQKMQFHLIFIVRLNYDPYLSVNKRDPALFKDLQKADLCMASVRIHAFRV